MVLRNDNNNAVNLPQPRSERAKKFVTYHGAKIWNDIPPGIKNTRNPVTFKIKLKNLLLEQY